MVRWRLNDVQNGVVRVDTKQLSSLIRQEPISRYYHVEQPPFAIGAFANVCRAHSLLDSGRTYAAKFCTRRRSGLDCTSEIHHEIALLSLCSPSPRIVRLHDVFQTPEQFIIIMEYAPGGDMQTIIDNNIVPFEADVVRFVQHVVEALSYLHHRRIAHLDIKPQNLVLMGDFPHCDVKVCDFEISRVILDGSDIHEILGTPEYVAPEILHYEPITLAADMWSLGVTVYVLLTGFSPFGGETDQETFLNISRAQLDFPDELFDDVSDHAKDFISKLLRRQPKDRMTAKQCLRHPWLAHNKSRRRHNKASSTATPVSVSAAGSSNQLRKYLSKSREALFERVVAKHQQQQMSHGSGGNRTQGGGNMSHGNKSRYDRTRRLCESQMSLVSRSREQLLLTGNKRCLSRDKLYGIRHLSKSHEVLNSLAGALVAQQQMDKQDKMASEEVEGQRGGVEVAEAGGATTTNTKDAPHTTSSSSLQTVLTLICDSKNNNNHKEQTNDSKEQNGSTSSNSNQPKPSSAPPLPPSTPETESKVLIAIEKLEMAMNERNNNKSNNNKQEKENKNNSTITADEKALATTADQNKISTTADQNKISTTADQNKISTTADENKISTTADENKISTTADENKISTTADEPSKMTSPQVVGAADTCAKRQERPRLLFTAQTSSTSSADLSPTTDDANLSSSEADVSEPDSANSTWHRIDEEEPRFTVAQLVSAFNKHQALVTKTSLEVTMSIRGGAPESKILPDEVSSHTINRKFPIGPDALRLFIPGIKISEHSSQKTQAQPTPPTTPPVVNINTQPETKDKQEETNNNNKEKTRKLSPVVDKNSKPAIPTYPTLDCSSMPRADPTDFTPPTPPPPPTPSSEQTRNHQAARTVTRHRASGRQATTLAASSKIRKKSTTTTSKTQPFYS